MKYINENAAKQGKRICEKCGEELEQTGTKANDIDGSATFFFRCPKCRHRVKKFVKSPGKKLTIYDRNGFLYELCWKIVKKFDEMYAGYSLDRARSDPEATSEELAEMELIHEVSQEMHVGEFSGLSNSMIIFTQAIAQDPKVLEKFERKTNQCIYEALTDEEMYDFIRYVLYQSIERFETIQAKVTDIKEWQERPEFEEWLFNSEFQRPVQENSLKFMELRDIRRTKKSKKRKIGRK